MSAVIVCVFLLLLSVGSGSGIEKNNTNFSWLYNIPTKNDAVDMNQWLSVLLSLRSDLEDATLTFEEIVTRKGYPVETHEVITEDGYILTIHRIPYGTDGPSENRPVVFLQHGLLNSAVDWIILGPSKALAYTLANLGYDVWLGNARGSTYSRRHQTLDPDDDAPKFWDFSWHEIGYYDIPTMVDYVLAYTGQEQLFHIGFSQGTTTFYVMASTRPEYNEKIRAHFSLSPVAYMGNLFSPFIRMAAVVDDTLYAFMRLVGLYEFLPSSEFIASFGAKYCADDSLTQFLCTNALFAICGFSRDQVNTTLLPIITGHTPAGAATKQVVHYGQLVNSKKFRQWDYGMVRNLLKYGSLRPPSYDVGKITAPVYLFYSSNDWLSAVSDVRTLESELGNVRGKFLNPDPRWNHLDYIYGIDAYRYVYAQVVSLMTRH